MPTRFCVKNIGKPSSISMAKDIIRNIGETRIKRKKAKSLLSIRIKRV